MEATRDVGLCVFLIGYGMGALSFWAYSLRLARRLKGRRAPVWLLGLILFPPCLFWGPIVLIRALVPETKPENENKK